MPVENGYGFGDYTSLKAEHFNRFIQMHLSVTQAVMERNKWWCHPEYMYFDLTAGPGIKPDDGTEQSPLLFLRAVREKQLRRRAHFFERDADTYQRLCAAVGSSPDICCKFGDHKQELLRCLADAMPKRKADYFGLMYYDPTPCGDMFQSYRLLAELSTRENMRRVDVLLYMSGAIIKRMKDLDQTIRLTSILNGFQKKHWLIRESFGKHQWTFLFGTNYVMFPDWRAIRFFRFKSEEGQEVYRRVAFTESERKEEAARSGLLPFPV